MDVNTVASRGEDLSFSFIDTYINNCFEGNVITVFNRVRDPLQFEFCQRTTVFIAQEELGIVLFIHCLITMYAKY